MAAPHASGVAALVWSQLLESDPTNSNPLENRDEVIRRLRDCADHTGAMGQNMLIWSRYGRLNAHGAVTCGDAECIDYGSENCSDGLDNDCDGLIDGDDSDCASVDHCLEFSGDRKSCRDAGCSYNNRTGDCTL